MKVAQPLRDVKRNTELLILVEILENPDGRLREVADRLGITVQAVSQYLSAMREEGLLKDQRGNLRPTRKGMQILQEHFVRLKDDVDAILRRISVIDTCVAFAGGKIRMGQKVGLVMESGKLVAYPERDSSSVGRAIEGAAPGEDILVGQLEGIVDMDLGKLLVIETPPETDGGSKAADLRRAKQGLAAFSPGLLVAADVTGSALLAKVGRPAHVVHAPVESAMSALSKGVDVAVCGTKESVDRIIDSVTNLKKETGYRIAWKTLKA